MEKIRSFVQNFLESEAKVTTAKRVPDLEAYNDILNDYYSYLVRQLQGTTGHMPMTELDSEEEYEMMQGYPDDKPRHLFKISKYTHPRYGNVWVAYVSERNASFNYRSLSNAIIIIEEDREYKIAKFLLYTNYTDYGHNDAPFRWDDMSGTIDLNFETLKNPIDIERYLEPVDEGVEIYNSDI